MPPGQLPGSLWDLHTKEMKTEQQILVNRLIRFSLQLFLQFIIYNYILLMHFFLLGRTES